MRSNKYYAVPEEGERLEHGFHKYIKKVRKNGKWRYYYNDPTKEKREPVWAEGKTTKFGTEYYNVSTNVAKREASGSSSLGNARILSDQTQNRLKAQSNAKKLATSGSLEKAKQEQAGYKKAASGLMETVDKKNIGSANKYYKKAKEASNKVASIGSSINAAKRKASGSSSLANQKQSTKKKKTSKVSKTLKKGQSIINKLLGR